MSIRAVMLWVVGVFVLTGTAHARGSFTLLSMDFQNGGRIPVIHEGNAFGCAGQNTPPSLHWRHAPAGTKSFALLVTDPDAPGGTFTHWVVYNIPASRHSVGPNSLSGLAEGTNDANRAGYVGPCPPPGTPHHYYFTLYALKVVHLPAGLTRFGLARAVRGRVLARATLIGTFGR